MVVVVVVVEMICDDYVNVCLVVMLIGILCFSVLVVSFLI